MIGDLANKIKESKIVGSDLEAVLLSVCALGDDKKEEDLSLILKLPELNISQIKEYQGTEQVKKFIFRPQNLSEYVGQEKAKKVIKTNLLKIKKLRPVHFLIDGLKGHGKSTLAKIIANSLDSECYEIIASEITLDKLTEIINWINTCEKLPIIFIDEIHGLDGKIIEILYPIMEDYKIEGKRIKPFVLIGATTEKNVLVQNYSPFVDRFQVQITLERYMVDDIVKILKQYKEKIYPEFKVDDNDLKTIAENCKFTPRIAISMLEDLLIIEKVEEVLDMHNIIIDGLDSVDIKILQILDKSEKPVGEEALAMMLGLSRKDYKFLHEAYLIEMGYMARGRTGRFITEKGKKVLEKLDKQS